MKEGQKIKMWAGESKSVTCTVTDADTSGSVNLTGASSINWVMQTELGGTTLLTKSTDNATACAVSYSGCTFTFVLVHADTDALQGTYYHEAEIVDSAGSTFKPCAGYVEIRQGAI